MPADPRDRVATFAVHPRKLSHYLLNVHHPKGGSNAVFFLAHGFSAETPDHLDHALCRHGRQGDLAGVRLDEFGMLFEIDGGAMTSGRRIMHIRTVWALRQHAPEPAEFVTAFPRRP